MNIFKKREKKEKAPRPLFRLTLIVIPMILVVLLTLGLLYHNGFFMTTQEKTIGTWTRVRKGAYSSKKYTEIYNFESDGTGFKTCTDKDGYTAKTTFKWKITEKQVLVIDGYIKYKWNANYKEYYKDSNKVATKYWYVTKDKLYLGEDTTIKYELYEK